ncbi:hypothetical protein GCM10020220_070450 [Nonomuraea rubra]
MTVNVSVLLSFGGSGPMGQERAGPPPGHSAGRSAIVARVGSWTVTSVACDGPWLVTVRV